MEARNIRTLNKPCRPGVYGGAAKKAAPVETKAAMPRAWIGDLRELCPPLTGAEEKEQAETAYQTLTRGKTPVPKDKTPHLVWTIGPQGAGKTTIGRRLVEYRSGEPAENYVEVDFDAALELTPVAARIRDIPDMEGRPTGVGFAYGWDRCLNTVTYSGQVLARLMDERYNLIVQSHSPFTLIEAQLRGYVCTLFYVAVSKETALRRAAKRAVELGQFVEPASAQNAWGWEALVESTWERYRAQVPWYALWADNFVVANNDVDGKYPGPDDFKTYVCHPPLEPDQSWTGVVSGFYAAMAAAHGEEGNKK